MVDTAQIIFTDHDGNTVNIFTKNARIQYKFPLEIVKKDALAGTVLDGIRQYRVISCTCKMSGAEVNTLNGYLMDTAKTYDATDPKVTVALNGDTSLTILVAVIDVTVDAAPDRNWFVSFIFEERRT